MYVQNIKNDKGNSIPNQFIIFDDNGNEFFQSYDSIIVKISDGKIYLDERTWNYSNTTAKYRRIFLKEGIDLTRAKIKSGEYILTNLN